MIYLFESELPKNKPLFLALSSIYGLSRTTALLTCKKAGFSKNLYVKSLSREQIAKLIRTIESLSITTGSDLLKMRSFNLKNLISIKSYRGLRRYQGLPVRGQRTHTNAKTAQKRLRKL